MHQGRNRGSPRLGSRLGVGVLTACCAMTAGCLLSGCQAKPTELRGKTSFGPEFRNRGNNTSEIRYTTQQAFDLRWDNGWSTGVAYRRRDVDEGSGDNENRVMFEVGYPLWKAPKKENKAADRRIEELQRQVEEMQARVAAINGAAAEEPARLAQSDAGQ